MWNGSEKTEDSESRRLSDDESSRISDAITGMMTTELPLAPGLRATAAEMPRNQFRLRHALNSVAAQLESGASVDEALGTSGAALPEHLRGLVNITARSGNSGQALGNFVNYSTLGADLRWRLLASLAYPVTTVLFSAGLFLFICVAIVGNFENIYRDFGVPLPTITMLLMTVARPLYNAWDVLLEATAGFFIFAIIFFLFVDTKTKRAIIGSLPLVGTIFRNISLAEFCHLLALLLESKMPLPEAIRLGGTGVKDASVERATVGVSKDVAGGMSLADAVSRRSVFPSGLARVLQWAEKSRSLPESLRMVGEMFASAARSQAEFAGTFLSVLAVLSILFGAATFVVGLLLPMIILISKLSG